MRTPITYYGGKQQLVSTILPMIPTHRVYCEPYFGGGAIFFAKGKSFCEVVNDINDRLITFYEVCQDEKMFVELMERVQQTLHSERYYKTAYQWWLDADRCYGNKVELDSYVERMGWQKKIMDMPLLCANRVTGGVRRKQEVMVYNYVIEPKLF